MCNSGVDNPLSPAMVSGSLAQAWRLRDQSRGDEAARICRRIVKDHPGAGEAWHLLGLLALDRGDHAQAVAGLKKAVAVEPRQALHYNNLGVVLNEMGAYAQAADYLRKALAISPDYHDAMCNLGLAHFHQNQLVQAARCFEAVIASRPEDAATLANLGMTALAQQQHAEAAGAYEKAVTIDPARPVWYGNLGAAYMRMGRFQEAARCYRQASRRDPQKVDYCVNLGIALRAAGDLPGSLKSLETALSAQPSHAEALANLVVGLEYTCQWDKLETLYPRLDRSTREALNLGRSPDEDPMLNIRRCADVTINRSVASAWSRMIQRRARRVRPPFRHDRRKPADRRITLGYLSYDFRNHPVAHQLFPLMRYHDRRRFRVIAFSMGPDDGSRFRREIETGCDAFVDIAAAGLPQAAQAVYDRSIDILIDLMGHTHHNRMEMLCLRPAPVQVSYLGFLSTSGAECVDYVVTDRVVVPPEHRPSYSEKLICMPHCYQMNHTLLINGTTNSRRGDWGLPEDGFVYCCFNMVYKIDRPLFAAWMRILERTPRSVLWLYGAHPIAVERMRAEAHKAGIDPQRLIFAEKIPLAEHLKRLPLADLALDTIRYNGGATTANALAAGLPVITVLGRHWVSRMSASHLKAIGLPDLVFNDLSSYEQAAVTLAHQPERLVHLKALLKRNLETYPLFDTRDFVRHLETGYQSIWRRYLEGHETGDIDLPATPGGNHG